MMSYDQDVHGADAFTSTRWVSGRKRGTDALA